MLQDDTDAAVETTLRMAADSTDGVYSNSAGPSRQATDYQSGIELSEMTVSALGQSTSHAAVITASRQENEYIIAATVDPPMQLNSLRASSRKATLLLIMFAIQASFYIFFAVTLAGVGANFLSGIPAIISLIGSAIAVMTVIMNFGVQVREGRVSDET